MITPLKVFEYSLKSLFPMAEIVSSGLTEEGFYCEAQLPPFSDEQTLPLIEEKVKEVTKSSVPIRTFEMMRENSAAYFLHRKDNRGAAAVQDWPGNTLILAEFNGFAFPVFDQAIGKTTGEGGALKILHVERGEENVIFRVAVQENPQKLKQWLKIWKEHRDHVEIGDSLALWTFVEGRPFWKPKGVFLRHKIQEVYSQILEEAGYPQVFFSPYGRDQALQFTERSGMFRFWEWIECSAGKKNRFGLFDTTPYSRAVFHAFIDEKEVEQELISSLHFFDKIFKIFGFEGQWTLATDRDAKGQVSRSDWDRAVKWLAGALEARGRTIPKAARHPQAWISAQEGPTLEASVLDKLGRRWLVASLGIDLTAVEASKRGSRVSLKGAVVESLERTIALLVEAHQGNLPWKWLFEPMRVIAVGQNIASYAETVHQSLVQAGFRVGLDCSESKLGAKVHAAEREQIPFLVVVGDRELKNDQIMVRSYEAESGSVRESSFKLDDFIRFLKDRQNANGR